MMAAGSLIFVTEFYVLCFILFFLTEAFVTHLNFYFALLYFILNYKRSKISHK